MSEDNSKQGLDILEQIIKAHRAGEREAMSLASVAAYVQGQNRLMHDARRQNAQVDALLKAKFAACGQEDVYEPPTEEDDMGATLINCTFNSEESVKQIAQSLQRLGAKQEEGEQKEEAPPQKKSWWKKVLPILAAVGVGSAITFATAKYFSTDPNAYEITALPYVPTDLRMGRK